MRFLISQRRPSAAERGGGGHRLPDLSQRLRNHHGLLGHQQPETRLDHVPVLSFWQCRQNELFVNYSKTFEATGCRSPTGADACSERSCRWTESTIQRLQSELAEAQDLVFGVPPPADPRSSRPGKLKEAYSRAGATRPK